MNLKPLVNDVTLYRSFIAEIEERISVAQSTLECVSEVQCVFAAQGEIKALRKLLLLREKVNEGSIHV